VDLFDLKTIQIEAGLCPAFHLIKKVCQRNKHLKMKLTPLFESPKHSLVETAKSTGKYAEKREKIRRITSCIGMAQCNQALSDILDTITNISAK